MDAIAIIYENSPLALKTLMIVGLFAAPVACIWIFRAFPRRKTLSEHDIRNIIQAEFCREAALKAKQEQLERQGKGPQGSLLDHTVIEWLGER